jgi:hypothetical protein
MLLLACLVLSSCKGQVHEFAEVDGKVSLGGAPLHGAIVRFYPMSEEKQQLPYATARTDADGAYFLKHGKDEPGALIGQNRVVVYWPSRDMRGDAPPPSRLIPLKYASAQESPLIVEVKTGGRQTVNLVLEE